LTLIARSGYTKNTRRVQILRYESAGIDGVKQREYYYKYFME